MMMTITAGNKSRRRRKTNTILNNTVMIQRHDRSEIGIHYDIMELGLVFFVI